jgi:hypothetical protein
VSKALRTIALFCTGIVFGMINFWGCVRMVGRLGNRNTVWRRGVHCFPIDFGQRSVLGKPLDQVGIRDVRTAERHQICQSLRDKAIAASTVQLHVRDQRAFVERSQS